MQNLMLQVRVGFKGGEDLWAHDVLNLGVDPRWTLKPWLCNHDPVGKPWGIQRLKTCEKLSHPGVCRVMCTVAAVCKTGPALRGRKQLGAAERPVRL